MTRCTPRCRDRECISRSFKRRTPEFDTSCCEHARCSCRSLLCPAFLYTCLCLHSGCRQSHRKQHAAGVRAGVVYKTIELSLPRAFARSCLHHGLSTTLGRHSSHRPALAIQRAILCLNNLLRRGTVVDILDGYRPLNVRGLGRRVRSDDALVVTLQSNYTRAGRTLPLAMCCACGILRRKARTIRAALHNESPPQ